MKVWYKSITAVGYLSFNPREQDYQIAADLWLEKIDVTEVQALVKRQQIPNKSTF